MAAPDGSSSRCGSNVTKGGAETCADYAVAAALGRVQTVPVASTAT